MRSRPSEANDDRGFVIRWRHRRHLFRLAGPRCTTPLPAGTASALSPWWGLELRSTSWTWLAAALCTTPLPHSAWVGETIFVVLVFPVVVHLLKGPHSRLVISPYFWNEFNSHFVCLFLCVSIYYFCIYPQQGHNQWLQRGEGTTGLNVSRVSVMFCEVEIFVHASALGRIKSVV